MPREVEREILLNAADVGDFFEVCVGLLITEYREQYSVEKFTLIFFEYFLCCGKERNIHIGFSLLTMCDYPQSSVKHLLDIVGTKLGNIGVSKSCIAGEDEHNTSRTWSRRGIEISFVAIDCTSSSER